jgi:hypothetical protein
MAVAMETGAAAPREPAERAVVLVVAWGRLYIDRLARHAFSSLLAPGNLPHVAARMPVTLQIMTRAEDAAYFEAQPQVQRLRAFASVVVVPIDDIIVPGLYTVTLTLAYARGIALQGEAMTRTVFLSLNADFVLSDGSLAHVLARLEAGASSVMAASFKAVAEEVIPKVDALSPPDGGPITLSGRQLAAIGLASPHLTTVGKTVTQSRCWSRAANHIFWQEDETACVGRFLQIFFLGMRPTRVVRQVHGYCDYSFPELYCPDGPMEVISDSDDVMILEMQERAADVRSVVYGARPPNVWERDISEWYVPWHLEASRTPMLFHSGDRDARTEALVARSEREMAELTARLDPPVPNRGHYYWVAGVAAWFQRLADREALPPELDPTLRLVDLRNPSLAPSRRARRFEAGSGHRGGPRAVVSRLRERLWGAPPRLGPLNLGRESYAPVQAAVDALRAAVDAGARLLVVAPVGTWLDTVFSPEEDRVFWIEPDHLACWRLADGETVDQVLVMCRHPDEIDAQRLVDHVGGVTRAGARWTYIAHKPIWLPDSGWVTARLVDALLLESAMKPNAAAIDIGRQPRGLDHRDLGRVARAGLPALRALRYEGLLALYGMRRALGRAGTPDGEPTSVVVQVVSPQDARHER